MSLHRDTAGPPPGLRSRVLALAGVVGVGTTVTILTGLVTLGRGDPATRMIRSFRAAADLVGFASAWSEWSDNWPAGHFLIQGVWIRFLELLGVRSMFGLVQGALWLSVLAWAVTLLTAYDVVVKAAGKAWGLLCVAALLSIPLLTESAHNAYGAIFFAAITMLAIRALVAFETSGRLVWIGAAAVLQLAASTIRSEAIVISAAFAAVMLFRHGLLRAAGFSVIATSLTLTRALISLTSAEASSVFFQQMPQSLPRRFVDLGLMSLYLIVPTGLVLVALWRVLKPGLPRPSVGDEARLRSRLAEYAGAAAVLSYGFVLSAMLLMPRLGPDSRLLLVPTICGVTALVALASETPDRAWSGLRPWLAPWVVVTFLAQNFVLGIDYLTDRARPPAEVRQAQGWLAENVAPTDRIAIDHVDWWEQSMLLYSAGSPEALRTSFVSSTTPPPLGDLDPATLSDEDAAGAYLTRYHPRFVVLQGPVAVASGDGGWWTATASYVDRWVRTEGERTLLQAPGMDEPLEAELVMDNAWLRVLELDWPEGS